MLAAHPSYRVLNIVYCGSYLINRMSGFVTDGFLADIDISPDLVANALKRYQKVETSDKI